MTLDELCCYVLFTIDVKTFLHAWYLAASQTFLFQPLSEVGNLNFRVLIRVHKFQRRLPEVFCRRYLGSIAFFVVWRSARASSSWNLSCLTDSADQAHKFSKSALSACSSLSDLKFLFTSWSRSALHLLLVISKVVRIEFDSQNYIWLVSAEWVVLGIGSFVSGPLYVSS